MRIVSPLLPPLITYDAVPGREGLWRATVETSAGRISVTRHSLQETRDALESKLREAVRQSGRSDGS